MQVRSSEWKSYSNILLQHQIKTGCGCGVGKYLKNQHINKGCGKRQDLAVLVGITVNHDYLDRTMDIQIQSPWDRWPLFPAFLQLQMFDRYLWDQWDSEFFAHFHALFYYESFFWPHLNWWDTGMSKASIRGVNNYTGNI